METLARFPRLNGKSEAVLSLLAEADKNIETLEKLKAENATLRAKVAKLEAEPKPKTKTTIRVTSRTLNERERAILAVAASKPLVSRAQVVTRLGDKGIGKVAWMLARKALLDAGLIEQVDKRRRFATYRVTKAGLAVLK